MPDQSSDRLLPVDSGRQRQIVGVRRERADLVAGLLAEIDLQLPHGYPLVDVPAELAVVQPGDGTLTEGTIPFDLDHAER